MRNPETQALLNELAELRDEIVGVLPKIRKKLQTIRDEYGEGSPTFAEALTVGWDFSQALSAASGLDVQLEDSDGYFSAECTGGGSATAFELGGN